MSKYVGTEVAEQIQQLMFAEFADDPRERFLQQELSRYVPQLVGWNERKVADFVKYQRGVYLERRLPNMGRPIASLNPTFVDSIDSIRFDLEEGNSYIRASLKENGYRMQLHVGIRGSTAFTRQFTRYDLRMFPELKKTLRKLPAMIGDAELVNRYHPHLAGFNRVQLRIPNQSYWPKPGSTKLEEDFLAGYLSSPTLFNNGQSLKDTELTLVFHGIFAIAHPSTWNKSRKVQKENMISFCRLPIDYEKVDEILDQLHDFILKHSLNARVVERVVVSTHDQLQIYVQRNEDCGYEGTCVVQTIWDKSGNLIVGPRSIKIKRYETVDCALLGLILDRSDGGLVEENITGAVVGLYDEMLGVYLPVAKVNLDPNGVQIKTAGQKERLTKLRSELALIVGTCVDPDRKIYTLLDAFLMQGKLVVKYIFGDAKAKELGIDKVLETMPARSNLIELCELFDSEEAAFCDGTAKLTTVPKKFVAENLSFFQAVKGLDKKGKRRFFGYFSKIKQIKITSAKFVKPQVVVDTTQPIILETQVFDIKWGASPFAAGFHSWFANSFRFNNCFAERTRPDKSITTDYATVHSLARVNSVRVATV